MFVRRALTSSLLLLLFSLNANHITDSTGRFNYIMEAKLSSGSDGFGPSISTIQKYLDQTTCDSVQSVPTATAPTATKPTAPAPSPTSTSTVVGCRTKSEVTSPTCIVAVSSVKSGFACYSLKEILPPYCSVKQLRWVLNTCDGISMRTTRFLADKNNSFNEAAPMQDEVNTKKQNMTTSSNETTTVVREDATTFQSSSCSKSCVRSGSSSVCFATGGDHVVTFIALNTAGKQVDRVFKRTIALKTANDGSCRSANLQCVN